MLLENATTIEIEDYLKKKKSIILPFGSIEQHGPHLPCGTDHFLAQKIAQEAADQADVMAGPALNLGFSPGLHPQMKGTISLSAITYINLIREILSGLSKHGFNDFLILTAHGMNFCPLKTAVMDFLNDHNGRALVLGYWDLEEVQKIRNQFQDDNGVHCTIMETSMMLYQYPELVDMSKSFDEYHKTDFLLGKDEMRQISRSGIIANTTQSSLEKGKVYFHAAVEGIVRLVKSFETH